MKMKKMEVFSLALVLLTLLYIYLRTAHQARTPFDLYQLWQVQRAPVVSDRCKLVDYDSRGDGTVDIDSAGAGMYKKYLCLPSVLFIGASKCGTSSLARYISAHPSINLTMRRAPSGFGVAKTRSFSHHLEVHLFDRPTFDISHKGLSLLEEWSNSPYLSSNRTIIMHYTPHYIYEPHIPSAVSHFYPHSKDLKFIVLLRSPIARAVSSYWFKNSNLFTTNNKDSGSNGDLQLTFERELQGRSDYESCLAIDTKGINDDGDFINACRKYLWPSNSGLRHIDKGFYDEQLIRWFKIFPRPSFYIFTLEAFAKDPKKELSRLLQWLGIRGSSILGEFGLGSEDNLNTLLSRSYVSSPNSKQSKSETLRQSYPLLYLRLCSIYQPHIKQLEEISFQRFPEFYCSNT